MPGAKAGADNPAAAGSSAGGSSAGESTTKADVADPQSLIIMAGLQLAVQNPDKAADAAEQTAIAAGGYVAGESEGVGSQVLPSADITADAAAGSATGVSPLTLPAPNAAPGKEQALLLLRIPPSRLADVLATLSGGGGIAYRTQSETDVTGQVADVDSRVASAKASISELRGLIDKAASMNDLISLEQALASRESDLESLEAQQRALADQVAYATVTVGFFVSAGAVVAPPVKHRNPFSAGLVDSWHALIAIGHGLLAVIGWLLPFLVIVAILWWPVRRVVRMVRRRPARANTEIESVEAAEV
ncbi:DUF4349 domain-containing protein [Actinospica robiniae]|uniref:DUF4349 domain-containing protein n=1 Tax=Actinospica robiniae TaxID=304901 RepID=UPI0005574FC1|nr:DUF4349 domain-containing protein [Actinospica robiniae]